MKTCADRWLCAEQGDFFLASMKATRLPTNPTIRTYSLSAYEDKKKRRTHKEAAACPAFSIKVTHGIAPGAEKTAHTKPVFHSPATSGVLDGLQKFLNFTSLFPYQTAAVHLPLFPPDPTSIQSPLQTVTNMFHISHFTSAGRRAQIT